MAERGRIWVGDLLPECEDQDLWAYFAKFGPVREATVEREKRSRLSRGFGFLKMSSQTLVDTVLKEQHQLWDHAISVKLAADVTIEAEPAAPEELKEPRSEDPKFEHDKKDNALDDFEQEGRNKRSSGDAAEGDAEPGKFFVAGLPEGTTEDDLRKLFSQFGEVDKADLAKDPATQRSKNFGFVTMADPAQDETIATTKHELNGKTLDVQKSLKRSKRAKGDSKDGGDRGRDDRRGGDRGDRGRDDRGGFSGDRGKGGSGKDERSGRDDPVKGGFLGAFGAAAQPAQPAYGGGDAGKGSPSKGYPSGGYDKGGYGDRDSGKGGGYGDRDRGKGGGYGEPSKGGGYGDRDSGKGGGYGEPSKGGYGDAGKGGYGGGGKGGHDDARKGGYGEPAKGAYGDAGKGAYGDAGKGGYGGKDAGYGGGKDAGYGGGGGKGGDHYGKGGGGGYGKDAGKDAGYGGGGGGYGKDAGYGGGGKKGDQKGFGGR